MDASLKKDYLEQLDTLIKAAAKIPLASSALFMHSAMAMSDMSNLPVESKDLFKWKTRALSLIYKIAGEKSPYVKDFQSIQKPIYSNLQKGMGILVALEEDINDGYLETYEHSILAVEYTNLLGTAENFLNLGYKDPAGVLSGVALEEILRGIADKYGIIHRKDATLLTINNLIADSKKIYDDTTRKQIIAWNAVRDAAAHAKWKDLSDIQVKQLIEGANKLIDDYL